MKNGVFSKVRKAHYVVDGKPTYQGYVRIVDSNGKYITTESVKTVRLTKEDALQDAEVLKAEYIGPLMDMNTHQ